MISTPADVLTEWLVLRPTDARVAIAIDADRLLSDSGILGRDKIIDKNGREWQLVVFRGDDLAFRLRFRKASALSPILITLTRGVGTDGSIDVSHITDILARNESGGPLDLSLPAFFRRFCPQINLPPLELRRYKDLLLSRLDGVPSAATRIIEKWGRPDDWGRGQIAAMVILAGHAEMTLQDLWPNETGTVEFFAHALRLTLASPELIDDREVLLEMIREATRPQVRQYLHWLTVPPEEVAAFLVLRRFAADNNLQNPANQLAGLLIFSTETPLAEMEPLALQVGAALRNDNRVWERVSLLAEKFLTPRRMQRVMALLPESESKPERLARAILNPDTAPVILKQYLKSILLRTFKNSAKNLGAWVSELTNHPLVVGPAGGLSPCAGECRSGLLFLLAVHDVEERLGKALPSFPDSGSLLNWYLEQGHHRLELSFSQTLHNLEAFNNEEVIKAGFQYLLGGTSDLDPSPGSLKGRVRERLDALDRVLGEFVSKDPLEFIQGPRSALRLLRDQLGEEVRGVIEGVSEGRVWILVFDGMRYDTWDTIIQPILGEFFSISGRPFYCVLPSFTQISRTSFFAGSLAQEWRGFKGTPTKDEAVLVARNLGLTQEEQKTKLRFVTEADTVKARAAMGFADSGAREVNVLIYPISDECHDFRGDLAAFNNKIRTEIVGDKSQGVRGLLDDLLRRVRPEDKVLLTSDHGFIELLSPDALTISLAEAEKAGRNPLEDVRYRFLKGFCPEGTGKVVEIPGSSEAYYVAVGRQWFRREGVTNTPRYDHGGISLAEMVVPGFLLRRVTEKEARVEIAGLSTAVLVVEEDGQGELHFNVENAGNVLVEFDIRVQDNLGSELFHHRAKLASRANYPVKIDVMGKYRETPSREMDPNGTVTAVNVKLRHTDLKGAWRDAIDGSMTVPVRVKPKKTRLVTDALSGLDEV
jgi:hypothetical protein